MNKCDNVVALFFLPPFLAFSIPGGKRGETQLSASKHCCWTEWSKKNLSLAASQLRTPIINQLSEPASPLNSIQASMPLYSTYLAQ
jgi:hypothetical protein